MYIHALGDISSSYCTCLMSNKESKFQLQHVTEPRWSHAHAALNSTALFRKKCIVRVCLLSWFFKPEKCSSCYTFSFMYSVAIKVGLARGKKPMQHFLIQKNYSLKIVYCTGYENLNRRYNNKSTSLHV